MDNMAKYEELRPYTMREVRSEFLMNLYTTQTLLDKAEKRDGLSIAHTVLSAIDEGEPLFEIIPSTDNKDIAGVLHSLIYQTDEQLKEQEEAGVITPTQKIFINNIRKMAFLYDINKMTNSHKITHGILRLLDQGLNGVSFELKALGNEEDIEYYKSMQTNYYPVEGENIAGSLGEEYLRIVDACKTRTSALDQMLMVVPQEEQDTYRRHM